VSILVHRPGNDSQHVRKIRKIVSLIAVVKLSYMRSLSTLLKLLVTTRTLTQNVDVSAKVVFSKEETSEICSVIIIKQIRHLTNPGNSCSVTATKGGEHSQFCGDCVENGDFRKFCGEKTESGDSKKVCGEKN